MKVRVAQSSLELVRGDITREKSDAVVNAANSRLAGGGGVDGAIHRAGGAEIMAECRRIGGCPTGQAVITTAGNLPARFVIHTVGPVYRGGEKGESELLASAYRESLKLASRHQLESVSFPSLSTGAYGYPIREAAPLALAAVRGYLQDHPEIKRVRFVLFSDSDLEVYHQALGDLLAIPYSKKASS